MIGKIIIFRCVRLSKMMVIKQRYLKFLAFLKNSIIPIVRNIIRDNTIGSWVGNNKLLRENEINSRGIWWFLLPWFFSEICIIKKIFEIYRRLSAEISGKDWVTSTCAYSYLDFVRSSSLVFLNSEASKMLTARYFRSVSLIRSCFNVSSW